MHIRRGVLRLFLPVCLLLSFTSGAPLALATPTVGAGSTAAAPVYRAWADAYGKTTDFELKYDAVGSSAGIKKIVAKESIFGASDLAPSESSLAKNQLILVPLFVTGAVPAINLNGIPKGKLRLSGEVLADIFSGTINQWNAPAIQALNPDLPLPHLAIQPIVRADGSGTTYYFTEYLSAVSPSWKSTYGASTAIHWPSGSTAVNGSSAVARKIKETPGSIGYLDFNYVQEYALNTPMLKNAAGEYVSANVGAFRQALKASDWSSKGDFHTSLINLPAAAAWPITMPTFVLLPKTTDTPEDTSKAIHFFVWALLKGDAVVEKMSFVRLPDRIQALAFKALMQIRDPGGRSLGIPAVNALTQ